MIKDTIKKANKMNFGEPLSQENWAITMPKESEGNIKKYVPPKQEKIPYIEFKEQIFIKIVHY